MPHARVLALSLFLLLTIVCPAATHNDGSEPSVRIALENISLSSIDSERVQLTANVSMDSSRSVTLREITFGELRINGIPFYAAPISDRLVLVPNQKVMPSKPLLLTLYYHDLNSLKPLHSLVAENKLSITGMAYANLELNAAAKLFLFTSHPRVPVRMDSSVELHVPGGAAGKLAALVVVDHAQSALEHATPLLQSSQQFFSRWRQQLWNEYAPALVLARATYELKDRDGKTFQFESTAMGFRVSGKQVILPKSVLEPWKFDPYVAANMKEGSKPKIANYDLWLWPANAPLRDDSGQLSPAHAWCLSKKQIRILPLTKDDTEHLLLTTDEGTTVKVAVHRRQGTAALGLVDITDPSVPTMAPVLADPSKLDQAGSLAVFRFPDGTDAREARPDLLVVSATQSLPDIRLNTPIDSTAWGSPLISQSGIVGIITKEDSVVSITDAGNALKFSTQLHEARTGQ